jgi:hypothetical protein
VYQQFIDVESTVLAITGSRPALRAQFKLPGLLMLKPS